MTSNPSPPLASVIVVTRDRAASLVLTLAQLQTQDYAAREVIVVDNDSSDATRAVAHAYRARYFHVPSHYGIGYCRARGVDAARGDVIAFLDDDCVPETGWLSVFVSRLTADPSIGILAGRINNIGFTGLHAHKGKIRHDRNGRFVLVADPGDADYFGNANLAFRRDAIDAVGNYDPFFNVMAEIDLGARMRAHGYRIVYEPAAGVDHYHRDVRLKNRHFFYSPQLIRLYFFLRHHTPETRDQWLRFVADEVALTWRDLVRNARYLAWVIVKRKWSQLPNAAVGIFNTISARLAIPWLLIRGRRRKATLPLSP